VIFRSRTAKAGLLEPFPHDSNRSPAQAEGLCYQKNGSEDSPLQALWAHQGAALQRKTFAAKVMTLAPPAVAAHKEKPHG